MLAHGECLSLLARKFLLLGGHFSGLLCFELGSLFLTHLGGLFVTQRQVFLFLLDQLLAHGCRFRLFAGEFLLPGNHGRFRRFLFGEMLLAGFLGFLRLPFRIEAGACGLVCGILGDFEFGHHGRLLIATIMTGDSPWCDGHVWHRNGWRHFWLHGGCTDGFRRGSDRGNFRC